MQRGSVCEDLSYLVHVARRRRDRLLAQTVEDPWSPCISTASLQRKAALSERPSRQPAVTPPSQGPPCLQCAASRRNNRFHREAVATRQPQAMSRCTSPSWPAYDWWPTLPRRVRASAPTARSPRHAPVRSARGDFANIHDFCAAPSTEESVAWASSPSTVLVARGIRNVHLL